MNYSLHLLIRFSNQYFISINGPWSSTLYRPIVFLLMSLFIGTTSLAQKTYYVTPTGTTPAASATTSWATSTTDLQGAINASSAGDQVWVAAGVYKPTSTTTNRNASFSMKSDVTIYGSFRGDETSLLQRQAINPVIGQPGSSTISGDINNDGTLSGNSYHLFVNSGVTNTAVLDGFVITGGNAESGGPAGSLLGGGMINYSASPGFRNCSFLDNHAVIAGLMFNSGGNGARSNPVLTNCVIQGNSASDQAGVMYNDARTSGQASPILTNCVLQGNSAYQGGVMYNIGDNNGQSGPLLINCTLLGNSASQQGDITLNSNNIPVFVNCILYNNGTNPLRGTTSSVTYSLLESRMTQSTTGPGNLTATSSPFSSSTSVALAPCSPAINAGNPASVTVASGPYSATALPATDLAGTPRIANGRIDMGAVEYQSTTNIPLVIVRQPVAGSVVCAGTTVLLSVSATGSSATYQWNKNGTALTGVASASTANLTLTNVQTTDAGSYSVVISGDCPSLTSTAFSLKVPLAAARLYVKANATGANTGLSWDDAFTDLQSALTYPCRQSLTEIWVTTGIYKPTSTTARDISFSMLPGVAIYGGFMGNETSPGQRPPINPLAGTPSGSILSGDIGTIGDKRDNSYHVIYNPASLSLTNTAILDGFLITGGNANISDVPNNYGGGVLNYGNASECSPSFRNCVIQDNSAKYGGAMYNYKANGSQESPQLTNCVIQNNSATSGGGIYNFGINGAHASPVLTNCVLQDNSASEIGGGMYNSGVNNGYASPVLINCVLQGNTSSLSSGAVMFNSSLDGQVNPELTNCVLWNNGGSSTFNNNSATVLLRYSLYEPEMVTEGVDITGPGNLTTTISPFVSATSIALAACSPAINAGNPASITVASGPYSETVLPATDLAGNARIANGRIDMGAVEYQSKTNIPLVIVQQPVTGSAVCTGSTVTVSVSATGSSTTYQWYKNGTALTGIASASTASLTLTNVQTTDAGSYSVVISGDCPSLTSTAFSLTVNALPSLTVTAAPSAMLSCANLSLTLTATSSATALRWSTGETTTTIAVSTTGVYSVTATGANGCTAVSNNLTVTQDKTSPTVSISALSTTLTCTQPQLTLTATASATALHWSTGETTTTIAVSNTGVYSVTATAANGCTALSNSLTIGQNFSLPAFTVSSATVCPGQSVNLTASGCSGQIRWSTGATTAMITLTSGSSTSLLTATCTVGICSTTANGQVVVGGIQPPPAQILTFTADESTCPVRLMAKGTASSFIMTGPGNYAFSTVFREGSTYDAFGLNVKLPGTYTLSATYTNSCGTSIPVTRTVTVGRSCP